MQKIYVYVIHGSVYVYVQHTYTYIQVENYKSSVLYGRSLSLFVRCKFDAVLFRHNRNETKRILNFIISEDAEFHLPDRVVEYTSAQLITPLGRYARKF